jgi:hypothetical protein
MAESFNKVVTEALLSKEEVKFTSDQKNMINDKLGMARFQHTKQMLRAQRDGKRRLQKMKEKHFAKRENEHNNEEQNANGEQKEEQKKEEDAPARINFTAIDSMRNAPSKAKLKRTKKIQRARAKALKIEQSKKTVFEVDGDGNPYDKVRLHLTDEPHVKDEPQVRNEPQVIDQPAVRNDELNPQNDEENIGHPRNEEQNQ